MAKLRYRLLKDSYEVKKGAIFEEYCENGDQDFKCDKKYFKHADAKEQWATLTLTRNTVMKSPEWFERIYTFCDIEITETQKQKLLKLIGIKKRGRPRKK